MPANSAETVKIRLGTRQSPLAMAQAEETKARLCKAHGWSQEAVELVPVVATGDKILDRPLAEIGGKALWTRELDQWLGEGRIDAAVHSMKDVETLRPDAFAIAAVLPRADKTDRLIGAGSIDAIAQGATVGTSAPRRAAQLLHRRPDITVVPIRGNVATRLDKLARGEVDATFLASAGLVRLGQHEVGTPLSTDEWLPAPAQGAIGIECRADDGTVQSMLGAISDERSYSEILVERALLEGLGGTCHSPIAALSHWEGDSIRLTAAIYSMDGCEKVECSAVLSGNRAEDARTLASELLAGAPASITSLFAHGDG